MRNADEFFSDVRLLRELKEFQDEVAEDPEKYQRGVLLNFAARLDAYGHSEFDRMFSLLLQKNFPNGLPENRSRFLQALVDRHKVLWSQVVQKAFGTAQNTLEGRTQFGQPSIIRRIAVALFGEKSPQEKAAVEETELKGIARTRMVSGKRMRWGLNLTSYMQMVYKTNGMNFYRDFEVTALRIKTFERGGEQLFLINSHVSSVSSKTCRLCAGRVFTRESLRYAAMQLSPNLFHPNCVHYIVPSFVETEDSYEGEHGPVVTLAEIGRWISQGKTNRAKRPAPLQVNI